MLFDLDLGVNCQYWDGLNVSLEFVEPVREDSRISKHREQNPTCPLHHLAFEVSDLGDAVEYFRRRGYAPMEERHYFGPRPKQRVMFLSPIQTGGLLIELVCSDGGEYQVYGGVKC